MEEQNNQQLNESAKNSKNILVVAIAVIVTIILVGGGMYWWQQSIVQDSNQEIQLLQQQVSDLQLQIEGLGQQDDVDDTEGDRVLLTSDNYKQYFFDQCIIEDLNFNYDVADTTVRYNSVDKGIALDIPYNSKWGNLKYKIKFFKEGSDTINFGPMGTSLGGCSLPPTRAYGIILLPALSADQVIENVEQDQDVFYGPFMETIGSLTIIKYQKSGMCANPTIQVIGNKYNYVFTTLCGSEERRDEIFDFFEDIIETIELID